LTRSAEAEVADAVFQQAFIPRKLDEVTHFERDRERLAAGHSSEGIYYQVRSGLGLKRFRKFVALVLIKLCQWACAAFIWW
jgi:transketolase